jgi:hypothetical protein
MFSDPSPAGGVNDKQGWLMGRGSTLAGVPGGLTSPSNDSITLYTGMRSVKDGGPDFEVIVAETVEGEELQQGWEVNRYISTDLKNYAAPHLIARTDSFAGGTVARSNTTGEYMLLFFKHSATSNATNMDADA